MATAQRRRSPRREWTNRLVWVVAAVSAVVAALSPARPVGLRAADVFWCGLLGLAVPLVASRARRWALLWAGAIAAVVGVGGDVVAKVSAVGVLVAMGLIAFSDRRDRVVGAVLGALAVQALLRGPDYLFLGAPTIVGAVALVPLLFSAATVARTRERKVAGWILGVGVAVVVVLAALAGIAALQVRPKLDSAADYASSGLDQVGAGDTQGAAEAFGAAEVDFADASSGLEGFLTMGGRFLPVVGQHVEALRQVAAAGEDLSASAVTTATTADYRDLKAEGGVVDLARVTSLQAPVRDSADTVNAAVASVAEVRSPWLLGLVTTQLDEFDEKLADAASQTELAAQALEIAPALLGADGPKHYFVSFSTPAESRPGGGFVGAYGLLRADRGDLELLESGDLAPLNPEGGVSGGGYAFEPPPGWQERYGSYFTNVFLGNHAASPDWPTDASVIAQLFPQTPGGLPVDGVIYADPAALAAFLQLTGPIEVEGIDGPLNAENAEQYLLRDQYEIYEGTEERGERKELLGDVARVTFDALTSRPLPGVTTLTEVLGPAVAQGHLRVSVFEPTAQAFLDEIDLSGRWEVRPGADVLSVRSANLLANKIDAFLFRDVDVATSLDPETGELRSTVTVTLRNDAPEEANDYLIGNELELPSATNLQVVGLYSPHRLAGASLDGEPAGVNTQSEFGVKVFSAPVELAPGQTRTLVFELEGAVDPTVPYLLDVLPQALANPDTMAIRVAEGDEGDAPIVFDGPLDRRLELSF